MFRRANKISEDTDGLTKWELSMVCRKLVGHHPIVGWLWTACSFIKKQTGINQWEDKIDQVVPRMIQEIIAEVRKEDPVKGEGNIWRSQEGVIWCDTSSLALGALLEIGGVTAEDAAWLRKRDDSAQINVAELDATMKGINLTLKWGLQEVEIGTDLATVASWIKLEVSGE